MSEKILNHFEFCLADNKLDNNYLFDGVEHHLPMNKIYDFWNDYLSIEHDLDIKEIPNDSAPIIIDFWPMLEPTNVVIGKICEKIVNEIKNLVTYNSDYRCFIFKNIEDTTKLRLYFAYFIMDMNVVNTILIEKLHEIFSNDKIQGISIPNVINFFDTKG